MNALLESEAESPKVAAKPRRPGSVLRDERKTQGLSVEEVAEELRLPPRYVTALETGEYSKLPGETFARGYLRNYAAFLDIEPAPLLEAFARNVQPKQDAGAEPTAKKNKVRAGAQGSDRNGFPVWVIAGVALAMILGAWLSGAFQSEQTSLPGIDARQTASSTLPAKADSSLEDQGARLSASDSPTGPGDAVESGSIELSPEPTVRAQSSAEPAENPVEEQIRGADLAGSSVGDTAPIANQSLVIAFSEDCWIRIRDGAGNTLAYGVKKAGEVLSLESGAPYSLLIGNAGGVLVSYNGQPVDLAPHNDKNVAKFTLK